MERPSVARMAVRVFTLSCPRCGRGRIFESYFRRAEKCECCQWKYERGDGYWVGGSEVHMFLTYGLSVFLCAPLVVWLGNSPPVMIGLILGHVALSLLLFRYSRSFFLGLDYLLDPTEPERPDDDDDGGTPSPRGRAPRPAWRVGSTPRRRSIPAVPPAARGRL